MVTSTVLFSHDPGFGWGIIQLCGLVCVGVFLVALGFALWARWDAVMRGCASIGHRFSENPRFGLFVLLELFFGFAVYFAMVQWIGEIRGPGVILSILAAIGTVGLIHLVFGDAVELFRRPVRPKPPQGSDPWEDPAEKERIDFLPPEDEKESS